MLTPTPQSPTFHHQCSVLLDDAQAGGASSRLYHDLVEEICWNSKNQWDFVWAQTERALTQGYYAVAFLQYESGAQLLNVAPRQNEHEQFSRILVFRHCRRLTASEAQDHLRKLANEHTAGIREILPNITEAEFTQAIDKIRDYIAAGDTYQVNFTYRLNFKTFGPAAALYLALRQRQPVPYGAFATLPHGECILSFSPELFVQHLDGMLLARPMKGTAAASGVESVDQVSATKLSQDPKNRAENLMIVDLLRNDLGRIAETGSVKVPRLFEVTRFSSVLQMTSSIEAKLRPEINLASIMRALFPCGSITGAPKKRTMEIIREVESEHRGLYTGAIGWFDPISMSELNKRHVSNFCLSVPIRTLELEQEIDGQRRGRMGVGAGIVYDSEAIEEFAECQLKARFLTGLEPSFKLFETMFATKETGCRSIQRHLHRLQNSARYFGFAFNESKIQHDLKMHLGQLLGNTEYRLRLELSFRGEVHIQSAVLTPLKLKNGVIGYLFNGEVCQLQPALLNHKTSARAQYDAGWQRAEAVGGFDTVFVNQKAYITEGGRSTIFVKLDGEWCTPPLSDGVLPGILREQVLQDRTWQVHERSIRIDEFLRAEEVMLGNSLRGLMPAIRLYE